jgi:hypothetical protein
VILESFLFGLAQLTEVPQLERLIMPQLFKTAAKQVLAAVAPDERWVLDLREKLQAGFDSNLPPLAAYLRGFDPQVERLKIDVA